MSRTAAAPPGFWRTLATLLAISTRRAFGRLARMPGLMRLSGGRASVATGSFAFFVIIIGSIAINLFFGWSLNLWVSAAQHPYGLVDDRYIADSWFMDRVRSVSQTAKLKPNQADPAFESLRSSCFAQARDYAIARVDVQKVATQLCQSARERGPDGFVDREAKPDGLVGLADYGPLGRVVGSVALILWMLSLALLSVRAEADSQRRRHPMWEWLFSHPAPPSAIFLAEALAPIFSTPAYFGAPFFCLSLFANVYGVHVGWAAVFLVGVPTTIAIAGLGKAIETSVMLRFAPRSRGAILGILGWLGTVIPFIGFMMAGQTGGHSQDIVTWFRAFEVLPWPWIGLFLGEINGSFSFVSAVIMGWLFAALVLAGAIGLMVFAARHGVGGATDSNTPTSAISERSEFVGPNPLYRKEILWFRRDRSALLQVVLVPVSMTALQLFNMRQIAVYATGAWNYLAGVAILLGVFFLFALSPKALASEGAALWISLTWPRGLEELMRAKARLWAWLASLPVVIGLAVDIWLFPRDWLWIALVGVGWAFFVRSFALKAVTLISAPSSSGEPEAIPTGRRWAVSLGSSAFAFGIISGNWAVATTGIFYAFMSAAAMWQNFRARLPYLFDPWSEPRLKPPTLTHAMVSISALVEFIAIWTVGGAILSGRMTPGDLAVLQASGYAAAAIVVALCAANFLRARGVTLREIASWPSSGSAEKLNFSRALAGLAIGLALGLALAGLAHVYLWALEQIPLTHEWLEAAQTLKSGNRSALISYGIMAVALTPPAEEFLFRGMLFRALDQEWGGWRAVLGSACFFASYHPFLSWPMVALFGAISALLFKRTRWLGPSIAMHAVYNATVLLLS